MTRNGQFNIKSNIQAHRRWWEREPGKEIYTKLESKEEITTTATTKQQHTHNLRVCLLTVSSIPWIQTLTHSHTRSHSIDTPKLKRNFQQMPWDVYKYYTLECMYLFAWIQMCGYNIDIELRSHLIDFAVAAAVAAAVVASHFFFLILRPFDFLLATYFFFFASFVVFLQMFGCWSVSLSCERERFGSHFCLFVCRYWMYNFHSCSLFIWYVLDDACRYNVYTEHIHMCVFIAVAVWWSYGIAIAIVAMCIKKILEWESNVRWIREKKREHERANERALALTFAHAIRVKKKEERMN